MKCGSRNGLCPWQWEVEQVCPDSHLFTRNTRVLLWAFRNKEMLKPLTDKQHSGANENSERSYFNSNVPVSQSLVLDVAGNVYSSHIQQ